MQFISMLLLLLLPLLSLRVAATVPEVVMGPSLLNAFLNSTVNFTCSGRGPNSSSIYTTINWRVNSAVPDPSEFEIVTDTSENGYAFSRLIFTAKQELNNSFILCTVFTFDTLSHDLQRNDSPLAYIRIQGLLNPVTNLTLQYGANLSFLSWVPPFSLDGLDVRYNATLSNSSYSQSFYPSNVDSLNISTGEFLSPCSTYRFTVQPWNDVGVSSPTYLTKFFPGVPKAPMLNSVMVYDIIAEQSEGDTEAVIQFPVTSSCFTNQNITAISSSSSHHYETILTLTDNGSEVILSVQGLPPDELISLELTLSNRFGEDSVRGIEFSTYDTQSVVIVNSTSDGGRTCFQCQLSTNSSALGCHLVLTPKQSHCSLVQSANLSINSSTDDSQTFISCLSGLYSGTYTVSAYDIESDGSRSKTESLTNDLAINGLSCPSPTVTMSTSTTTEYSPTNGVEISSVSVTLLPSNPGVNDTATVSMTIGMLVVVFVVVLITVSVLVAVFVYNRCHNKGGVLTITSDRSQSVPMDSNRRVTETARSSTVDTDSPELMTVHPSYTSGIKSKYSPQLVATEPVTTAMTPKNDDEDDEDNISKPPLNKMQILVLQSDKVNSSRSSSTSSGSAESFPPLRYTRYGSGEYDHLTGQENQEVTTVPMSTGEAAVQLDSIVIDSKPFYKESEIL